MPLQGDAEPKKKEPLHVARSGGFPPSEHDPSHPYILLLLSQTWRCPVRIALKSTSLVIVTTFLNSHFDTVFNAFFGSASHFDNARSG